MQSLRNRVGHTRIPCRSSNPPPSTACAFELFGHQSPPIHDGLTLQLTPVLANRPSASNAAPNIPRTLARSHLDSQVGSQAEHVRQRQQRVSRTISPENFFLSQLSSARWCHQGQGNQHALSKARIAAIQQRRFYYRKMSHASLLGLADQDSQHEDTKHTELMHYDNVFEANTTNEPSVLDESMWEESSIFCPHRVWRIQELLTKKMAVELLVKYMIDYGPVMDGSSPALDGLVQDLRQIKWMLREIDWTKRLTENDLNPRLDALADSHEAHDHRDELDLQLIELTKVFEKNNLLGPFIEALADKIFTSEYPPTHRSLSYIMDALRFCRQFEYSEIVYTPIRNSRLPWSPRVIRAMLLHYRDTGNGTSFGRFLSFLCTPAAMENGMIPWTWWKVPGQVTVPLPKPKMVEGESNLMKISPSLLASLISTAFGTGQSDYGRSYLQIFVSNGWGLSPQVIWSLGLHYSLLMDWNSGEQLLREICEGLIPICPEVTTPIGLQRFFLSFSLLFSRCQLKDLTRAFVRLAARSGIEPPDPNPWKETSYHMAFTISQWEQEYDPNSTDWQNPQALFQEVAKLMKFDPDCPGFIYETPGHVQETLESTKSFWENFRQTSNWLIRNNIRNQEEQDGAKRDQRQSPSNEPAVSEIKAPREADQQGEEYFEEPFVRSISPATMVTGQSQR